MLVAWVLLLTPRVLGLLLVALSAHAQRRRTGAWAAVLATGGLLLLLGDDLVAAGWFLVAVPLAGRDDAGREALPPVRPAAGQRLLAGVLIAGLYGGLDLVARRADWQALPAGAFVARTAELGARLVSGDLLVALALGLAWALALSAWPRGDRGGRGDATETP